MAREPDTDRQPGTAPADSDRRPYTAPMLTIYGNVVEMTAAGSGDTAESGNGNWAANDCDTNPGGNPGYCGNREYWRA